MVDKETILKVAAISRINLDEKEILSFKNDFEEVLKIFSKLDEVQIESDDGANTIFSELENWDYGEFQKETLVEENSNSEAIDKNQKDIDYSKKIISLSPHSKDSYIKGPKV